MALNPDTLSGLIKKNLSNKTMSVQDSDGNTVQIKLSGNDPGTQILCDAVAKAVVQHIIAALDIEVPPASFLIAATAGIPAPTPTKCLVS
jgi:hypothetical protein